MHRFYAKFQICAISITRCNICCLCTTLAFCKQIRITLIHHYHYINDSYWFEPITNAELSVTKFKGSILNLKYFIPMCETLIYVNWKYAVVKQWSVIQIRTIAHSMFIHKLGRGKRVLQVIAQCACRNGPCLLALYGLLFSVQSAPHHIEWKNPYKGTCGQSYYVLIHSLVRINSGTCEKLHYWEQQCGLKEGIIASQIWTFKSWHACAIDIDISDDWFTYLLLISHPIWFSLQPPHGYFVLTPAVQVSKTLQPVRQFIEGLLLVSTHLGCDPALGHAWSICISNPLTYSRETVLKWRDVASSYGPLPRPSWRLGPRPVQQVIDARNSWLYQNPAIWDRRSCWPWARTSWRTKL